MKIDSVALLPITTQRNYNHKFLLSKNFENPIKSVQLKSNADLGLILRAYNFNISFGSSSKDDISDDIKKQQVADFLAEHPDLSVEDACTCLALNLSENEILKYKELKNNYPSLSLMELALITKFDLLDSDITRYIHKSSELDSDGNKKFDIPNEEMLLCFKEGFDDMQLSRYAELRNRTIDLKDKSVRKTGGMQKLPIMYVLNAVKENKSDDNIRDEERFYTLLNKYGMDYSLSALLFVMNENLSDNDFYSEADRIIKSNILLAEQEHDAALQALSNIEDNVPRHLKPMYDSNLINLKNSNPLLDSKIGEMPENISIDDFFEYANLIISSLCESELADFFKSFLEPMLSSYKSALKLGYSNIDSYIFVFLPKDIQDEIINRNTTLYDIYAMYLPDEYRHILFNSAQNDIEKSKQYICKLYAFQIFVLKNIYAINEYMRSILSNIIEIPELDKDEDISDKDLEELFNGLDLQILSEGDLHRVLSLIEQGLPVYQAYIIAKHTNISSITPELLDKIPENVWYLMQTGTNKQTHDIIEKAIKLMIEFGQNPPELKEVREDEISDVLPSDYSYDGSDLDKSDNSLSCKLQKLSVLDKPVLVAMDNKSDNSYVALNGAVAMVAPPFELNDELTDKSLESHCNLSKEKQLPILKRAIKEFALDVTDDDGDCIISKGIDSVADSILASDKTKDETENYFIQAFDKLKQDNNLNAQNILRLFPKDAILSVNPYTTTANNMLYSISAEWKSKDGTKWEMRIHSTDLSPRGIQSENWISRAAAERNRHRVQVGILHAVPAVRVVDVEVDCDLVVVDVGIHPGCNHISFRIQHFQFLVAVLIVGLRGKEHFRAQGSLRIGEVFLRHEDAVGAVVRRVATGPAMSDGFSAI